MTLLLVFLFGAFVLGIHSRDAATAIAPRLRIVMVGAFVLGIGYLNLRMI